MDNTSKKEPYDFHLISGEFHHAKDSNGYSDPFIKVFQVINGDNNTHKELIFKSKTCEKTLYPKWNEVTVIQIHGNCTELVIEAFDEDMITFDDFYGNAIYKLGLLSYGGKNTETVSLFDKKTSNKEVGTIKFTIEKK